MVTPATRREALEILKTKGLSERAACRLAGVSRRIASYALRQPAKDQLLSAQLMEAAARYPRFGYRRIAVMTGQRIGRVWRLWRSLGLNLPTPSQKAPLWAGYSTAWGDAAQSRLVL
jgi:putative transposase